MTSFPLALKNLALHPPQKSALHKASGWEGHLLNKQGSMKQLTFAFSGGQSLLHLSRVTQELEPSSMTVPLGHSQRGKHCSMQDGLRLVQVGGQAEPQTVKT